LRLRGRTVPPAIGAHEQVFAHRHATENAAAFRDERNARPHDILCRSAPQTAALIKNLAAKGQIPTVKLGRTLRVPVADPPRSLAIGDLEVFRLCAETLASLLEERDGRGGLQERGLVETGLDLLAFPTLHFYETGYSLHTLRQASRHDINVRSAFVHMMGDALGTAAIIAGGGTLF
jgi:Co/Zn/Cd efflux system component